jgi:hypothetical protein
MYEDEQSISYVGSHDLKTGKLDGRVVKIKQVSVEFALFENGIQHGRTLIIERNGEAKLV